MDDDTVIIKRRQLSITSEEDVYDRPMRVEINVPEVERLLHWLEEIMSRQSSKRTSEGMPKKKEDKLQKW